MRAKGHETGRAAALVLAVLLAVGLAADTAWAQGKKPVALRHGHGGGVPSDIAPVLFTPWMQQNVLKHYGKVYTVQWTRTKGSPHAAAMLAAGEADLATLSFTTIAFTVLKNSVPGGVKVVADSKIDGYPGYRSNVWVVRAEEPIHKVEDLKGRVVSINEFGAGLDVGLRVMLRKHGLDPLKDVNIVEINFGNQGPALRQKRIDLALLLQPFEGREFKKGGIRRLFTLKDAIGANHMIFQVATNKILKEQPEAVRAFFDDYVRGLQWYLDPKNRPKMLEVVAEFTKLPKEAYGYFLTTEDDFRDPNACPRLEYIQRPVDLMLELGFIKERVDVSKHFDTSYLPSPCKS